MLDNDDPEALDTDKLGALYDQGLALEKAGDAKGAATFYRDCLALDPADHCGVCVRLASLGLGDAPLKAPDAYVMTLFDQHAADFDQILMGDLGYAVPMQLAEVFRTLDEQGPERRFARMLDLGCGTGLCGLTLGDWCDYLAGVDLSEKMTDEADERAVYDALFVNEAVHFLEEWHRATLDKSGPSYLPFDLIVATDVLPYIGALEPLFDGIAKNLVPGGSVALSCETMADADYSDMPWRVTPNQRFAHHLDYLTAGLASHGLTEIDHVSQIIVRYEEGKPIPGWLILASHNGGNN